MTKIDNLLNFDDFNENLITSDNIDKKQHLLIVHHEGGDEIHFNVIDYSFYPQITKMLNDGLNTQQKINNMVNLIQNNILEHMFCQTYVLEDYNQIRKYNIIKCIYLPELGA